MARAYIPDDFVGTLMMVTSILHWQYQHTSKVYPLGAVAAGYVAPLALKESSGSEVILG